MRRTTFFAMASAALFLLATRAHADDEPEIAVEASASEIFVGESVEYVVEIRNAKNPAQPDLKAHRQDFDVVSAGEESQNRSQTFMFNGKITQQTSFGHSYKFRLTPKRAGKLLIPAPSVKIDGKTISGRALALHVIAPEPQDIVVPEISMDHARVYPTQPFEVTLRVFVRPLPDDADRDPVVALRQRQPHIDVNWVDLPAGLAGDDKARWLEKLLSENGGGFTLNDLTTRSRSFFAGSQAAVFNLYRGRESRKGLDGRSINYFVYELKRRLTAEKPGAYTFGPAVVKGIFVEGTEGGSYTGRRVVSIAPTVPLEVRDVPEPRPATFCGGIGEYRLTSSANPSTLRVGDPLTLTLDVERGQGSGSLDLIKAPDLAANPQIVADFEIIDRSPTGRKEGDVKRFDYALRPKRAGAQIPPVVVSVFNPDTERFTETATKSIALNVSAGSRVGAAEIVGATAGSATTEIKSREQGIFQNVTDPREVRDERVSVVALAEVTAGAWCGVGFLIAFVSAHRRKSGDVLWQRKRQARRAARSKLGEARKLIAEGQSKEALRAIRSALVGLIADMRNIVAEGLTASEADAALARTPIPAAKRADVLRMLEAIESAEYGSGFATDAGTVLEEAEKLVPSLARDLERGV
jgi:hypothetical protein